MADKEVFDENGYLIDKFLENKCVQLEKISVEIAKYAAKIKLNGRQFRQLESAVTDFSIGKIITKRFDFVDKNMMKGFRKKKQK